MDYKTCDTCGHENDSWDDEPDGYYDSDDNIPEGDGCPRCGSLDVTWQGGDTVVNVTGLIRVLWFGCEGGGHEWSESEDYG